MLRLALTRLISDWISESDMGSPGSERIPDRMDLSSAADLRRRISSMSRVEIDPLSNNPDDAASEANSSGRSNSSVMLI